jgi:hypothetical protein
LILFLRKLCPHVLYGHWRNQEIRSDGFKNPRFLLRIFFVFALRWNNIKESEKRRKCAVGKREKWPQVFPTISHNWLIELFWLILVKIKFRLLIWICILIIIHLLFQWIKFFVMALSLINDLKLCVYYKSFITKF